MTSRPVTNAKWDIFDSKVRFYNIDIGGLIEARADVDEAATRFEVREIKISHHPLNATDIGRISFGHIDY